MLDILCDGAMVMDTINALIKTKRKTIFPMWLKVLDIALTGVYLCIYFGVLILLVKWIFNG